MWGRNNALESQVLNNFVHQGSGQFIAMSLSFSAGIWRDKAVATISKWNHEGPNLVNYEFRQLR